jgi:HD-GYP domain-containing protein (c-di-GMP phosphodiesterase class II)
MLKRIAHFSSDDTRRKQFDALAGKSKLLVFHSDGEPTIPASISAVVADENLLAPALLAAIELGDRHEVLLNLIAEAVDCREGFPEGASRRVMEHATRFAIALGLSPEDQLLLERGALIRDIGKIRIPNSVLLKEGVLSYEEWSMIQQHPSFGAEIVAKTQALNDVYEIVRDHHESYDGDGYPAGLEGDAIPYLARAMKILDVYCAMTSPRHYRKGHASHEGAVEYLRSEHGKHFDPKLVDVFIQAKVGRTDPPEGAPAKKKTTRKAPAKKRG